MTRLTCTRDKARSKIEMQVAAAQTLQGGREPDWDLRYENWDAHNRALLESLFEDSGLAEEYATISTGMPIMFSMDEGPRLAAEARRDTFKRRLNRLSSFVDRLEFYDEPKPEGTLRPPESFKWVESLHPEVRRQAGPLVASGHYAEAIRKSAQHLHNCVRELAEQIDSAVGQRDGVALVSTVFGENPLILLTPRLTKSERDEHDGLRYLFMGAMAALRNPRSHETDEWAARDIDLREVVEWLGLLSALHRALDRAPNA